MATVALADSVDLLVIRQKSGNETSFSLETNPIITFEGENMIVADKLSSISFPIADIAQYHIVTASAMRETATQPRFSNGQVTISDLPNGTKAYIHTMDGKVVREIQADGMGRVTFNVSELPRGIYIISVGNTRFKIANK